MKKVTIHTDGACEGNPGPGGWATILEHGVTQKEFFGGEIATTNNRMEMEAAIQALSCLKERCEVELFTDSEYLRNGITKWIHAWKAKGWKKPIKNKDLWQRLDAIAQRHKIKWQWVRGHTGNPGNERCDVLASQEAQKFKRAHTSQQLADALARFQQQQAQAPDQPHLLTAEDDPATERPAAVGLVECWTSHRGNA